MIEVKAFSVGSLGTNCYVVTHKETGETAVVDPGGDNLSLMGYLDEIGEENIKYILLTHGHYDHIASAKKLSDKYSADIVISEDEEIFLRDENLNLAGFLGCICYEPFSADILLADGDKLALGDAEFTFILTSGHTLGSGCYVFPEDRILFSGDTLFAGSIGRTDFPTSDYTEMIRSLKKLRDLKGDFRLYPGHNSSSTLDYERKHNMFMR